MFLLFIHYITHQCIWKYFSFQNLKEKLSKQEVLPTLDSLDVCSLRNDLLIFGVHCWTLAENLTNTDSPIPHRWRHIFTHADFSVVESIPTNFEKARKHLTWWYHRISFRTNSLGRVQCVPTFSLILLLLFSCLSLQYSSMSTYCSRIRVF